MDTTIHFIKKITLGEIKPLEVEGKTSYIRMIIVEANDEKLEISCFGANKKDLEIGINQKVKV